MRFTRHLFVIVVLLGSAAFAGTLPCGTAPCDTNQFTTSWNNFVRYYDAYFPAGVTGSGPYPLIVYLPGLESGYGYNTPSFLHFQGTVLQAFADANKVAVLAIAPTCNNESVLFTFCSSGSGQWMWDANFFDEYYGYAPDDVGFINSMISTATGSWGADGTRIMLLGASTGGMEANRFAQAYPSTILSMALFAGPLWAQESGETSSPAGPTGPVNVYIAHGDEDAILPYCGGMTSDPWAGLSDVNSASEDVTFNYWATGMSCGTPAPNTAICTNGSPSSGVLTKLAAGCTGGKSVLFNDYSGAGHIIMTYGGLCDAWNFTFPNVPCQAQPTALTVVTSSVNPATVSQSVALMATVGGNGPTPTGTVTFMNGANAIGTLSLGGGQSVLNRAFGLPGTRSITAVYSGDAYFQGSTSPVFLQGVGGYPTTTTMVTAIIVPAAGEPDTFTATVSSTFGIPTGAVTFIKDGTTTLGTASVIGGEATFTRAFGEGVKSIVGIYSGDQNFAPSTSQPLLIDVSGN